MKIPFNRFAPAGNEFDYIQQAVRNGHVSGAGPFTEACESLLANLLDSPRVLMTTSCTHALELAALLLDVQAGDEVIVPSYTFVSTINAFVLRGARPVFADIHANTLNLDERHVAKLINERTRVIVPVHYAGVGCEMERLQALAGEHNIAIVEDNAHGLFGSYQERPLGSFGVMSTLSFHETKNFSCGEGGALVINCSKYTERAEVIREKGTNRSAFFRGQVDKYSWVDVGSSYVPSDILAAVLMGQLEQREQIQANRKRIWHTYRDALRDWADRSGVRLPFVPENCQQAFHMFYMLMPSLEAREALIRHLRARDILAVFHYLPLHLSPMGRKYGGREGDCPVAEEVADRLVRLPFYTALTERDQEAVIEAVLAF